LEENTSIKYSHKFSKEGMPLVQKMEMNINAILQCHAIPLLLLHGKVYNDNHPPNTLACHFNERNLQLPKFNCPNNGENIVHVL